MTTYVLERLGVTSSRTAFVTQIEGHLFRQYRVLCRALELRKDVADLITTADDPFVDIPDDFLKARSVSIGATTLTPITFEDLMRRKALRADDDASTGPLRYAYMDPDRFYLDPVPTESSVTAGLLFYVAGPDPWTESTDEPEWLPLEYHDLIPEMAIIRMGMNQEEFSTHVPGAQAVVAQLRAELEVELAERPGDGSSRIRRTHYG